MWKKRRFSFMNYRNQICVAPLSSECRKTCLMCIDFCILSMKDLVLWGTPVYFDYTPVKAKIFKDPNMHMHTRRVTHAIVWCTAECNRDLLWAWELMPACTKHVHNKQISWSITLVWDCYKNGGRNPTVFLDHWTMDFPQISLYTNLTNFFWSQKKGSTCPNSPTNTVTDLHLSQIYPVGFLFFWSWNLVCFFILRHCWF